jgi:uncharacterized membrane protein
VIDRFITKKVIATAQLLLSVIFLGMYFYTLHEFIHGHIQVSPEWKDVIQTLLAVLTASVLQIMQFWFSRSRPEDHPKDPGMEAECRSP